MRRFVVLLLAALALYIVFRVGQAGWSIYQAKMWSHALWQQVGRGPGAVVDLAQLGPTDWDRVYIFRPYTSAETIQQALGFRWPDAERTSIEFNEGVNLMVFVKDGESVGCFEHPRNRGDLTGIANMAGYSREDARFLVVSDGEQRLVLAVQ
jgi:hypothetical protein